MQNIESLGIEILENSSDKRDTPDNVERVTNETLENAINDAEEILEDTYSQELYSNGEKLGVEKQETLVAVEEDILKAVEILGTDLKRITQQ